MVDEIRVLSDSRVNEIVYKDFVDVLLGAFVQSRKENNPGKAFKEGVKLGAEGIRLGRHIKLFEVAYDEPPQERSLCSGVVTIARDDKTKGRRVRFLLKDLGGTPNVTSWSLEDYGQPELKGR